MKPEIAALFELNKRSSLGLVAGTRLRPGDNSRVITFIASTDGLDRHGTKILPMGINTERFDSNPIIGWGHDLYGGWFSTPDPRNVIGKSVALRRTEKRLETDIEFLGEDVNPNADMIFKMVKAGAVNAVSIGFIPRKVEVEIDSAEREVPVIALSELLEISVVPIPSNPDALAIARGLTLPAGAGFHQLPDFEAIIADQLGNEDSRFAQLIRKILAERAIVPAAPAEAAAAPAEETAAEVPAVPTIEDIRAAIASGVRTWATVDAVRRILRRA